MVQPLLPARKQPRRDQISYDGKEENTIQDGDLSGKAGRPQAGPVPCLDSVEESKPVVQTD